MEQKSIKEIVKTPSQAIQFMIDGLLKQSKRRDFVIDMGDYGSVEYRTTKSGKDKKVCVGCAATCAIQEVAGKNLSPSKWLTFHGTDYEQGRQLGFSEYEVSSFENAIDKVRKMQLAGIFRFFNYERIPHAAQKVIFELAENSGTFFVLGTSNWKHQLPKVQILCNKLKELGY
jgi:hypothetical protein